MERSGIILLLSSILIMNSFSSRQMHFKNDAEKPQVIKLERFRKALWKVNVTINNITGEFLFDTGGGQTLLSEDFSKVIGCKFWGRTTGYNMFGNRGDGPHCDNLQIHAGNVALTPVSVGKINFGDQFSGDLTPDGLLSLDAFDGKAFTLDQEARTITIETPSSLIKRIKDMHELPMRVARECSGRCLSVFVGVNTPEGITWLGLDSGAGGVSLIAKEYAHAFGLNPEINEQQLKYEISPGILINSPIIITDMIMDGNLGQPFMSEYIITFDLAQNHLWLKRAKSQN
jgi:hypothetical protein